MERILMYERQYVDLKLEWENDLETQVCGVGELV